MASSTAGSGSEAQAAPVVGKAQRAFCRRGQVASSQRRHQTLKQARQLLQRNKAEC